MKIWALVSNVDDLVEQHGFRLFDNHPVKEWYDILLMDYADIEIVSGEKLAICYRGEQAELPDAFWPMLTNTDAYCLEHMLLEAGCKSILDLNEVAVARSKVATYQRLAANGIRVPKTIVFFNHPDKKKILERISFPFVVKPDNGYGGTGVTLIEDEAAFDRYLAELQFGIVYMAQEYIGSSKGKDVRMIYCMGEYMGAVMRQASDPEEFRSNLHVGGNAVAYQPDEETKALCKRIAGLFDLPILGIDLLFGEEGTFVVTEVNSSPGLDAVSNNKVASQVVGRFLEREGRGK